MRLLIIGNSHVGSLKRGWDLLKHELRVLPGIDLRFAAVVGDGLSLLETDNCVLKSEIKWITNSIKLTFGESEINLKKLNPDAILFYGLSLPFPYYFFKRCRVNGYSSAFLADALANISSDWGVKFIKKTRFCCNAKFFLSEPFRADEKVIDEKKYPDDSAVRKEMNDVFSWANNNFFNKIGVEYFTQPFHTMNAARKRTKYEYTIGSRRLIGSDQVDGELHPQDDRDHMNELFGKELLVEFLDYVEKKLQEK